ncbi:MAG: CCA tRNA nucleotidyltransferase [Terriglobia bacterium]|jgi:poly(A) polymerase|nr:CCA tRNA nucleotidyltransferase [Terriglobia bacterium]
MLARRAATEVVRTLRSQGHQAYFVGGCVRDLLLGRDPADFDVSTDATPDQVMRIFPQTYAVGAQFGVVLVPFRAVGVDGGAAEGEELTAEHPKVIEVATFRSDGAYSDGRHPDAVRYSADPREDVQRRDFTINGLMLDPLDGQHVLDYVGGQQDLQRHLVRTIGDPERRFREDKLRMMRAVRFAARFEYKIDAEAFAAIRRLAPEILHVSHERQRDEITKMLTEGHARRAFELLDSSGLLHEVLPEVEKMKGVEQPPQFHPEGDVWIHTLLLLGMLKPGASRTLAWGALLHDVGKPPTFRIAPDRIRFDNHVEVGTRMAEAIGHRFRMSNDDIAQIMALVANHLRFADVKNMKESTFKRFIRLPRFDEHLELHRIDCLGSHGILDLYCYTREKMAQLEPEQVRPTLLIDGHDLLAAGYEQGPRFKEILSAVEDAQLEGRVQSKEEAMEFVRREFPLTTGV